MYLPRGNKIVTNQWQFIMMRQKIFTVWWQFTTMGWQILSPIDVAHSTVTMYIVFFAVQIFLFFIFLPARFMEWRLEREKNEAWKKVSFLWNPFNRYFATIFSSRQKLLAQQNHWPISKKKIKDFLWWRWQPNVEKLFSARSVKVLKVVLVRESESISIKETGQKILILSVSHNCADWSWWHRHHYYFLCSWCWIKLTHLVILIFFFVVFFPSSSSSYLSSSLAAFHLFKLKRRSQNKNFGGFYHVVIVLPFVIGILEQYISNIVWKTIV